MSKNIDLAKGEGHLRPNENNSLRLLSLTFWRLPSLPAKVRPAFEAILPNMHPRTLSVVERLIWLCGPLDGF